MSVSNIIPIYIALAEIFYLKEEIPPKVSVDEAIWLVKIFSDDSSRKLVNGVLNKVLVDYFELQKEKENHDDVEYSIFK
jgi:transcription termination factor NusB